MLLSEICAGTSWSACRQCRNLQSPLRCQKEQSHRREESKPPGLPHLCYFLLFPITAGQVDLAETAETKTNKERVVKKVHIVV